MASLKIVLRTNHEKKDGTYNIAFRLTIDRKTMFKKSGYSVKENQFQNGAVKKHPDTAMINRNLEIMRQKIMTNLFQAEAGKLPFTHEAIFTGEAEKGLTIGKILSERADYFEKKQSIRSWRRVKNIQKELLKCWGSDLTISEITEKKVQDYEFFLREQGNASNTIWKKIKICSQAIDRQKDQGNYAGKNAFKLHKIPKEPVNKGKLTWEEIQAIEKLKLDGYIEKVRDLFLFSFFMQGMRFENCILFEKKQAKDIISYKMNKGKKHREIEIHPKLDAIFKKYLKKTPENKFLFNFVQEPLPDRWHWDDVKGSVNALVNTYLKRIAILAGIDKKISFHIARHTFADLLKKYQASTGKANIYLIKEALGHSDIRTTEMYLASLGNDEVNKEVNQMFSQHE